MNQDGQEELNATVSQSIGSVATEYTVLETSLAATVLCVIILFTIIGNCTICYVVFKNKRMHTVMNMFLVNLAIGDLAVGFLSMIFPFVTAVTRKWIFNEIICQVNATCNSVLFCSTIFTHTVISIDRYFALVRPMKKIMTAKKALLMILGVWILSIVIVLGPVFGWGHMAFNPTTLQCGYGFPRSKYESLYMILLVTIAFILPLIIMTVLYIRIFRSLRGHTRRMSTVASGSHHQTALRAQIRIGATFFLALLAFFVCWAPFCVFIGFAVVVKEKTSIPHGLGIAAYICGFVNSICNPFIVGLRSEQFREAFAAFFCCCCYVKHRRKQQSTKTSIVDGNGRHRSKISRSDSETKLSEATFSKDSNRSSYVVDARHIREELDRDAAQRDALPEYDPQENPSPWRKRKTGIATNRPQETSVPYKQFIHVVGGSSFRESGV